MLGALTRPEPGPAGPTRVLICDDHRVLTNALALVIQADRDLELVCPPVSSASEAPEVCRALSADVVLMDISFVDGSNGIKATRQIRDECPDTSVAVMIAHHDPEPLVDVQGGRAWMEQRPGGGSSFRVTLPVAASG